MAAIQILTQVIRVGSGKGCRRSSAVVGAAPVSWLTISPTGGN
jgi:hypothetical protein